VSVKTHILRLYQIIIAFALIVAMAGCSNANREKALQNQINQLQAEKAASDDAKGTLQTQIDQMQMAANQLRTEKTASDDARRALQTQVDQMQRATNKLVGTWRYRGSSLAYKLLTPTSWVVINIDQATGKITSAKGGRYTLQGDSYTEKIDYDTVASDASPARGQEAAWHCAIEDNIWHHQSAKPVERTDPSTGKQTSDYITWEDWERVDP
jgi:hypothetical protein